MGLDMREELWQLLNRVPARFLGLDPEPGPGYAGDERVPRRFLPHSSWRRAAQLCRDPRVPVRFLRAGTTVHSGAGQAAGTCRLQ